MTKMEAPPAVRGRFGGFSGNALKTIAIATMAVDHCNKLFVPREMTALYTAMDFIGYTTAPLLFYFLVEGFHRTRSLRNYALRLAVFAVISYVPYILATQDSWPNAGNYMGLNVMFTMLAGLALLTVRRRISNPVLRWALILSLFAVTATSDWSPMGLVYVLVFDYFHGDFPKQAFAYSMLCLPGALNLISDPIFSLVFGLYPFNLGYYVRGLASLGYFLPILLLYWYNGERGGGGAFAKWGFYLFYPAHFLVLAAVRVLIRQ